MKNIILLLLILLCINCKNKIETKIEGCVYTTDKTPIENIKIGTRVKLAPMKSWYTPRADVVFKQQGGFEFDIKRKEMKGDRGFAILFTKEGYKDEYRFIDLTKSKIINLDTIFMKPIDSTKSSN